MKNFSLITISIVCLIIAVAITGCAGSNIYGKAISDRPVLKIKEIEDNKADYEGKNVKIEGKITEVCQTMGCWFKVNDGTGIMYVDLEMGRNFVIPKNSVGEHVTAEGKFRNDNGFLKIVGNGVKTGGN